MREDEVFYTKFNDVLAIMLCPECASQLQRSAFDESKFYCVSAYCDNSNYYNEKGEKVNVHGFVLG